MRVCAPRMWIVTTASGGAAVMQLQDVDGTSPNGGWFDVWWLPAPESVSCDDDGDGVPDLEDVCPDVADPDQADTDGVAPGDACNDLTDADGDDWADDLDVCPTTPDPLQADGDGDGDGDACQPWVEVDAALCVSLGDPEGDALSGTVALVTLDERQVTLAPCWDGFSEPRCAEDSYTTALEAAPDEGLALVNFYGYHFWDWTALATDCWTVGCGTYALHWGTCAAPTSAEGPHIEAFPETLRPFCIRRSGSFTRWEADPVIEQGWGDVSLALDGWIAHTASSFEDTTVPESLDAAGLVAGEPYALVVEVTDGHTLPVRALRPFVHDGAPVVVLCPEPPDDEREVRPEEPADDGPDDDAPIDEEDPIEDGPVDDEPSGAEPIDDEPVDDEPVDDEPSADMPPLEETGAASGGCAANDAPPGPSRWLLMALVMLVSARRRSLLRPS